MNDEAQLRDEICRIAARMYDRNLVSASDGNISIRLAPDRILCTPSGCALGRLTPDGLVVVDAEGTLLEGTGRATSEFPLHAACYRVRADITCVIHAHPPKAIGMTVAGRSLEPLLLPELVFSGGSVPTAPYATPGTPEGGAVIGPLIAQCDTLMLDRHGSVTVGATLDEAYCRLEKLEHAAESLIAAYSLGTPEPLTADQIARILAARTAYGVTGKYYLPE